MCINLYHVNGTSLVEISVDDVLIFVIILFQLLFPGQDRVYEDGIETILFDCICLDTGRHLYLVHSYVFYQLAHPFDEFGHEFYVFLLHFPGCVKKNLVFWILMQELCVLSGFIVEVVFCLFCGFIRFLF